MLPHRGRVDLEPVAMKGYSAFPKLPALLNHHFSEMQSVYSAALADWANIRLKVILFSQSVLCMLLVDEIWLPRHLNW